MSSCCWLHSKNAKIRRETERDRNQNREKNSKKPTENNFDTNHGKTISNILPLALTSGKDPPLKKPRKRQMRIVAFCLPLQT